MVKLFIDYADKNNIILELNEKTNFGNYPILKTIDNNHPGIVKALIEYDNKHNIILEVNENNIK
eukprot:jgi/Orpsp1_1/1187215/evm.model.d7180000056150.1